MRAHSSHAQGGSALLVTILTLCILSILAGQVLLRVTARIETANRSAAWNEALTTAAAGVDMTIADLGALLPDVRINGQEGLAVGFSPLPLDVLTSLNIGTTGSGLASGITISYQPHPLIHGGETTSKQQATIFIDVLPLSTIVGSLPLSWQSLNGLLSNPLGLLNGGVDLQLLRIRSRGTVTLGGSRRADYDGIDSKLRRASLVWDRFTNQKALSPTMTREVEVLLRPVLPFQAAVTTSGRLDAQSASCIFDSFNSLLPTASALGLYTASKRLQNGDLFGGSNNVRLGGMTYGDVNTNGASIEKTERITGAVNNHRTQPLPQMATPNIARALAQVSLPLQASTLSAGNLLLPARYKFDSLRGNVRITRGFLGLGTDVEIIVTGDLLGSIKVDAGVRAKIYVGGTVRLTEGKLVNGSHRAANMQIYGYGDDGIDGPRGIELGLGDDGLEAAIYAPSHHVTLTGEGDFSGAVSCASFTASGEARVHFDEALALNIGPVLRYAVAAWQERGL